MAALRALLPLLDFSDREGYCKDTWKVFFSLFPPNHSLNPSEFKHLLPSQRQAFIMLPPKHVVINSCYKDNWQFLIVSCYRFFFLGLTSLPAFPWSSAVHLDSDLQTEIICVWIYSKRVRILVASSLHPPLPTHMHEQDLWFGFHNSCIPGGK